MIFSTTGPSASGNSYSTHRNEGHRVSVRTSIMHNKQWVTSAVFQLMIMTCCSDVVGDFGPGESSPSSSEILNSRSSV